jgi:argininosuccinate lyase
LVGQLVLESVKSGKRPSDWTAEALEGFAPEFKGEMARLLKPLEGMKSRELPGGTGPNAVQQAIIDAEGRLKKMREQLTQHE